MASKNLKHIQVRAYRARPGLPKRKFFIGNVAVAQAFQISLLRTRESLPRHLRRLTKMQDYYFVGLREKEISHQRYSLVSNPGATRA